MTVTDFPGTGFDGDRDAVRLGDNLTRIYTLMSATDKWFTLAEIADATGAPLLTLGEQIRHLRKFEYGGHIVNLRHVSGGTWAYALIPAVNDDGTPVGLLSGKRSNSDRPEPCTHCNGTGRDTPAQVAA
jgi:hypothetical protein